MKDPLTLTLTGQFPFLLLLAAALAFPIATGLLRLYHRAVFRSMRTRGNRPVAGSAPVEAPAPSPPPVQTALELVVLDGAAPLAMGAAARSLRSRLLRAPWRAAALYAVAGFCYAIVMTAGRLASAGMEFLPIRFLMTFWNYAWPVVLTTNLVAASTRRARLATTALYLLVLAALGAVAIARSPALTWGQIVLGWLVLNLPPTVLLLTFLGRGIRAVGPLVLAFMVIACAGSNFALSLVRSDAGLLRALAGLGLTLGLGASGTLIGLLLAGFLVFVPLGWLTLRWIRARYERKKISDQSITLDALWLLFAAEQSVFLAFEGAAWTLSGLCAFLVYQGVLWAGFSLRGDAAGNSHRLNSPRLLLLRVFSLGKRSERLFDLLARHWRYVGSTQLIAGPDLATTTIEPHELLDFLSGKLARRFIDGPETLDRRISEMDVAPDRDGRFRVNDFFCHDDTWRMALSRLVRESDAVLMDLRGFSARNAGCIFEIDELINVVPLERVVFLIDDTTDEAFLRRTVQQSWTRMGPASPNRLSPSGPLRLFRFTGSRGGELPGLLGGLSVAATSGAE